MILESIVECRGCHSLAGKSRGQTEGNSGCGVSEMAGKIGQPTGTPPGHSNGKELYFFLKHFSGPESGILEFDWLLTRVPPVQFFPIRTGFVMDH